MIARLKQEFEQMTMERRDNDKQLEEIRVETNHIHSKVSFKESSNFLLISSFKDGGPPQEKRTGTQRVACRILEIKTRGW